MEKNGKKSLFSIEITTGSLWKNILLFSLPLMMTQVLEVLFNLSDVAIAGKFADYLALGAVGSTTLLVSLFTGLLIGIGSGVNVVVARGLGLGSHEDVEKTIHTSLLICSGIGIVVCLVCLLLAKPMLLLLNTKEELLPGAVGYLRIYALGMPAMAVYNFGNGVLSAAGDTKPKGCLRSASEKAGHRQGRRQAGADDRHPLRPAKRHLCPCKPLRTDRRQQLRFGDGIR